MSGNSTRLNLRGSSKYRIFNGSMGRITASPSDIPIKLFADVKSKFHDIVGLHDVRFALGADFAFRAGTGKRAGIDKVVIINDFCGDETTFEITMDDAGGLRRS